MKKIGIYKITNSIDGKFYIGSSRNIKRRWGQHRTAAKLYDAKKFMSYLYAAMQKYGIDNFQLDILEECSAEALLIREQYYLDTLRPVYNISKHSAQAGREWKPTRRLEYSARRKIEVAAGINVPPENYMRGNKDFRHSEESRLESGLGAAKAWERVKQTGGSYWSPEGLASMKEKLEARLTPERRQQFAEDTKEALELAHVAFLQNTEAFHERYAPLILELQDEGLNFTQIAVRLTEQGHTGRHGGPWTIQTVTDVLARVGKSPDRPQGFMAEQTRKKNSDEFANKMFPIIDELRSSGLNMSEIAIRLNEDGHPSRRGATWTYANVREVIKRVEQKPMQQPVARKPTIMPDDMTQAELLDQPHFIGWYRYR